MFNIGDLVVYSTHGVCKIDDICEKTIVGMKKQYYELQPLENERELTISAPVHGKEISIMELVNSDEAQNILKIFKNPTIETENIYPKHPNSYTKLVGSGDRKEIAVIVNALMRKEIEAEQNNKKLNKRDQDFLDVARDALFMELSISLDTSLEQLNDKVVGMVQTENIS